MKTVFGILAFAPALVCSPQSIRTLPPAVKVEVPAEGVNLPMADLGGRPLVDVKIAGKGPFRFILDTGADTTVVDTDLLAQLGIPALGAGPHPGMEESALIPSMSVGQAELTGVTVVVSPIGRMFSGPDAPRGVISAAAFRGSLLTLDYPAKRIRITKGALPPADGRRIFQYTAEHILPNIPVRVAGTEARVHVDSGSPGALTLPTKYMKELPLESEPAKVGKARTHAGEFPIYRATVKGMIELGEYPLDLPAIDFSDVNPIPGQIVGNIGYRLLQQFVVTLDSQNRRIQLVKPS